jgi:hypothetical protein
MTNSGGNNVVPIFKTFDQLQADEHAIHVELVRDWNNANDSFDGAMSKVAALKKNPPGGEISTEYTGIVAGLKKFSKLNPSSASTCAELIRDVAAIEIHRIDAVGRLAISRAETNAIANLIAARAAALNKRDENMFGFGALKRRSQRFASAHLNRT